MVKNFETRSILKFVFGFFTVALMNVVSGEEVPTSRQGLVEQLQLVPEPIANKGLSLAKYPKLKGPDEIASVEKSTEADADGLVVSAESVSIAIASPKDSNPRAWPVYNYNLVQTDVEHGEAGAVGHSEAYGLQGSVAVQHSLAISRDNSLKGGAFADSSAIAISSA